MEDFIGRLVRLVKLGNLEILERLRILGNIVRLVKVGKSILKFTKLITPIKILNHPKRIRH